MFKKKPPEIHLASARVEKALAAFRDVVAELEGAADHHASIAEDTKAQMDGLALLHAQAIRGHADATRRANKLAELVA